MEMSGEQLIRATQADTWEALNDPEILKACVPGCESIERTGDNEYEVLMTARVGPVSAKFKGKLTLSDIKPPHSYSHRLRGPGRRGRLRQGRRRGQPRRPTATAPGSPTRSRRTSAASSRRSARAWWTPRRRRWRTTSSPRSTKRWARRRMPRRRKRPRRAPPGAGAARPGPAAGFGCLACLLRRRRAGGVRGVAAHFALSTIHGAGRPQRDAAGLGSAAGQRGNSSS